ncbi:MAG TPA: ABC transporter permease, partial [Kofleriaceae bacterium]|nr:ABC transporter permease [Kofleriaceae bacterium]
MRTWSALGLVARHEVRRAIRDRTALVSAAILWSLLATSVGLGWQRHTAEGAARAAQQALVDRQWDEQPDRHPHRVAHYGTFAVRPNSALGFFDPGLDPAFGTTIFLEAHRRNTSTFSEAGQASELVRFGIGSPATVLQLVIPLLLFCLGFASVAGERASGSWRQLLSQGIDPRTALAGKVLGISAVVAIIVAPFAFAAVIIGTVTGVLDLSATGLARLALLFGSYATYIIVCAALAILISAWQTSLRSALATSLAVWIALWVVVPRAAAELA